ncbi:Zn-dependent hydrolase [Merismopedia glauca CCAP 1448/3]|uniref:Zn-dependent hydrolase n=1 Tax=Merismopedia glauca CCAP 1448/3 TaxID=1296344 RepID=A0A2T1BZ54_9CYAN|nr:Zn-dependent hydrolase [Merismopedia glauca CCAP 1448/3]
MNLTWLDNNSWIIEIGTKKLLLDPWLVEPLVFANLEWLFKGCRGQELVPPEGVDLIVLSQGLEDHAHRPSLKLLDRQIPVVGSPNAVKVVRELGFTNVTQLQHGETFNFDNQIEIVATRGSVVGATTVENGYILKEIATDLKLYYEPHGSHPDNLQDFAPIDVVITPICDQKLPLVGAIIKGGDNALKMVQWLQPQVMLPTATSTEATYEGLIPAFLSEEGSIEGFRTSLAQNNLSTQVLTPKPLERLELNLAIRDIKP